MYTLFLDTHSSDVVIVLFKDSKKIDMVNEQTKFQHSQVTLPLVNDLLVRNNLSPKDINEIVVVNGPGSFTGVRIAVVIGKTMAYSLNIPIKTVDSLLIKAISLNKNDSIIIVEKEKNGAFIGQFDSNLNNISEYEYMATSDYESFKDNKIVYENVEIDYEKVINYLNKKESINPHAVKPLYIKHIGISK